MDIVSLVLQALTVIGVGIYTYFTYRLLSAQTRQGFENKFFQLLRFHHDIVEAIEVTTSAGSIFSGRPTFQKLYRFFLNRYKDDHERNSSESVKQFPGQVYASFFEIYQDNLGHYFRNLYQLLKFIDRAHIDPREKLFYAHLVRAQLSSGELLMLFYNCISPLGNEKFKPLVEKYALLENMPQDELTSRKLRLPTDHKSLYPACAYGES